MTELSTLRAKYPRVSEIIRVQNQELRNIPIEIVKAAAERGTKVHGYCTAHARSLWVGDEIEPEYKPYVDAFIGWYDENVIEIVESEFRLYDDNKIFTGEIDMLVKMKDNTITLVDIKTSHTRSRTWGLQLAAYLHLCDISTKYDICRVINLHLKKTFSAVYETNEQGTVMIKPPIVKADVIDYKDLSTEFDLFESALKCYHFFYEKEALK